MTVQTIHRHRAVLELALRAAGVGPGDEVLIPGFTFVASVAAVRHCGATPVLCDVISPSNPLLDPADAERRITERTRASPNTLGRKMHLYAD